MKKLLIICGSVFAAFIIISVCFIMCLHSALNDNLSKKEIFDLVNENYTVIMDDMEKKDFSDTLSLNGVKKVYFENKILDIYCGGKGFGSATGYYGFYYTPDNLPKTSWCGSEFGEISDLQTEGNGFSISYPNDDNRYYTEKIRDNFYYYEAHF